MKNTGPQRAKLDTLKPNPKNPRVIKDDKFQKLVQSIRAFPQMLEVRPIVCTPDGVVLGGNMRLRACKEAGLREVPVHVVSWLDSQQEEFIIKDNVGYGEWDWDILANEWDANQLEDWGLDVWTPEAEPEEGLTDPDEVPSIPEEPKTKPGDLYILGKHRLLCGDSTNAEHVARLMDGQKATLIHADPPYGMGKEKDGVANDNLYSDKLDAFQMAWWKAVRPHTADNGSAYIWGNAEDLWRLWYVGGLKDSERLTFRNEIVWDKKHGQGIKSEQHRMFPTVTEHCLFFMLGEQGFNNNADNYWEGWDFVVTYLRAEKEKTGWDIATFKRIVGHSETSGCHWFDKSQWTMPTKAVYESWQAAARNKNAFKRDYDELKRDYDELKREYYATRAYFDNTHDNMTDVWYFPRVTGEERYGHATPKPVAMMARAIKSSTPESGLVFEPFLGSGTTLIAAEKTGRTCYGMELDPKYCDVIVKRWEDFTGKKAELVTKA